MLFQRIKELAAERGVKMSYLDGLIGGYKGKINECRKGKSTLTDSEVQAIADFFEVPTDYLLGKTDIKNKPAADKGDELTPDEEHLIRWYRTLDREKQNAFRQFLDKIL